MSTYNLTSINFKGLLELQQMGTTVTSILIDLKKVAVLTVNESNKFTLGIDWVNYTLGHSIKTQKR